MLQLPCSCFLLKPDGNLQNTEATFLQQLQQQTMRLPGLAGHCPSAQQLAAALTGLEWDSPAGRIRMALGDGHQAVQDTAIGKTRYDAAKKMVMIDDIQRFPADCVNPPANMKSEEWIKAGFPGAKCP